MSGVGVLISRQAIANELWFSTMVECDFNESSIYSSYEEDDCLYNVPIFKSGRSSSSYSLAWAAILRY